MEDFILKERETKEKIIKAINESNLPALTIKAMLKEFLEQVVLLEKQQYEQALALKNSKKVKEDKKEEKNE